MMISAMLIFGSIGIFRRFIPLSSALLACWRGLTGTALLLLIVRVSGRKVRHGIGRKKTLLLIISGAMIGLNWILLFEAYNYTTVAVATLCYYMQPTIVVLLSPLIFREQLTAKKLVCALIAVAGMFFVSGVMGGGLPQAGELKGILCGLGAAGLYAFVVILNKRMPGIDPYEKTILQLLFAALVLLPYILTREDLSAVRPDDRLILLLLIVGLVHTGIAYVLYFAAIDGLRAQTAAILSYVDPISALVFAAIFLPGESLTVYGMIGAVMILGAALVSEGTGKKI